MSEDLISKEKAYKVLTEYYHHKTEMQHKALREALKRVPTADIDLSDYSDRLWRNAYEQGKADAESERKKGKWVPHRERSREYIGTTLVSIRYDYWFCDSCGYRVEDGQPMYNYCPNCGADMRHERRCDAETD